MDAIKEVLDKLEAPLMFSSRDSFKHLPLIKDLEGVMKYLLHRLEMAMTDAGMSICDDTILVDILSAFDSSWEGFDARPLDEKKERISQAIYHLNKLRKVISANSIVVSGMYSDYDFLEKISSPVQFVKGVGPKIAHLLDKKGVKTIEDLLYHLPRRYEDRRVINNISAAIIGKKETVIGKITHSEIKLYGKKRIYEVTVHDGHDVLTAKWFQGNQAYLNKTLKKGSRVIMTGEVGGYLFGKEMIHPDFEILDNDHELRDMLHFGRIVPIYSETDGLHQKYLRRIMMEVVEGYAKYILSPIPEEICKVRQLENIAESIRCIHFPDLNADIESFNAMRSPAHRRLIYDEFFFFELAMASKRKGNMFEKGIAFHTGSSLLNKFYKLLPFPLTQAQKRVIGEIEADLRRPYPMNRLLQGDVGCGKTVVAMAAMITACENGYQTAMMVPTEILAQQHHARIREWTTGLGLVAAVITGNLKASERKIISEKIIRGDIHIVIGTHALIQEDVSFNNLGLVIIDEQHRFGVIQRATLRKKGAHPDVIVMTATPIPRTLAMTVYGDLDVSLIDEMPPGRKEILTKIFHEQHRNKVYEIIRKELIKGNQTFIVYPLVEESESLDLKDATRMAEHLQKDIFPEYRVGLIHGRLKGRDKDEIMAAFLAKKINLLVSTTVIEVGIDIPQASLMIIEHAERFGLSQLHQLRGRVGRSDIPSYCVLMAHNRGSEDSRKRLGVMEKTNDGFKIAEEDLAIRGPGEFMGTRQSGLPDFRIANILRDAQILSEAKSDAFSIIERDSRLERPEHQLMKEVLLRRWRGRMEHVKTG